MIYIIYIYIYVQTNIIVMVVMVMMIKNGKCSFDIGVREKKRIEIRIIRNKNVVF